MAGLQRRAPSQIAELRFPLPLLILFVVGIFDFSGALSLKQKLTNAAREGARVAAADPFTDLGLPPASGVPASSAMPSQVVDNYLISEKINDCGLSAVLPTQSTSLIWTSTATVGCPSTGLQTHNKPGCLTQQTVGGHAVNVVNTLRYDSISVYFGDSPACPVCSAGVSMPPIGIYDHCRSVQ